MADETDFWRRAVEKLEAAASIPAPSSQQHAAVSGTSAPAAEKQGESIVESAGNGELQIKREYALSFLDVVAPSAGEPGRSGDVMWQGCILRSVEIMTIHKSQHTPWVVGLRLGPYTPRAKVTVYSCGIRNPLSNPTAPSATHWQFMHHLQQQCQHRVILTSHQHHLSTTRKH